MEGQDLLARLRRHHEPRPGDAAVRQHRLRAARPRRRARAGAQDGLRHGHHDQARRLPGRGPRRPAARRLAAGDGQRLRDDRLRRHRATGRSRSRRSSSPTASHDDLGKPQRQRAFTDGVTYEATKILEQNVQSGTGTAREHRLPGGRQDRHDDDFTDAWFVGFTPKLTTARLGRLPEPADVDDQRARHRRSPGGTFPARSGTTTCRVATKGRYCGDFPQPTRRRSSRSPSSASTPARAARRRRLRTRHSSTAAARRRARDQRHRRRRRRRSTAAAGASTQALYERRRSPRPTRALAARVRRRRPRSLAAWRAPAPGGCQTPAT